MTIQSVLLPLFVQVALTFVLLFWMGTVRVAAIRRGEVHPRDIALRQPSWPQSVAQVGNAYHNQFELPVLFYVLVILAWITRQADFLFVLLAWVFVVLRVLHAYVHVTTNRLPHRFYLFLAGAIVLVVMWVIFALGLLLRAG
jgi:hypothetical protein